MRRNRTLVALFLAAILPGCAPSYKGNYTNDAKKDGETREQQFTGLHYSYRLIFAKEAEDGKYTVLYSRLSKDLVLAQVETYVQDLSDLLDYPQDDETARYMSLAGRAHFEQEERRFKAILARVRVSELHDKFEQLLGLKSWYSGHRDEFGYDHSLGYDGSVFTVTDPKAKFAFTSKTIEEAKTRGLLKPVETYTVEHFREFDHKDPDPSAPADKNKFVWRSKRYGLKVTRYKVVPEGETPKDNYGDYLEAYRVNDDGKQESLPALRAFLDGRGGTAVAVIDVDQEGKDTGFGLPDIVTQVSDSGLLGDEMFTALFQDKENFKRIEPPKANPANVEIARVGKEVDVWEASKDPRGWEVPFPYKAEPTKDNYNVRLEFKKKKNELKAEDRLHGVEIDYVLKEYTNGGQYTAVNGRVVEYFRTRPPYNQPILAAKVVYNDNPKKLEFVYPDGREETGFVTPLTSRFIADKPEQVAFTLGEKRWLLRDEDGDGKYEKRKQVSPPAYGVGSYPSAGMDLRKQDSDTEFRETGNVPK